MQLWLQGLPPGTKQRVRRELKALAGGHAQKLDLKPLRGELEGFYRLRIGDYRIVYEVDTKAKQVLRHYVRHRRDIYRSL